MYQSLLALKTLDLAPKCIVKIHPEFISLSQFSQLIDWWGLNIVFYFFCLKNYINPHQTDISMQMENLEQLTMNLKSESTLAQGMACCLTASGHNLNQCWHIINEDLWHSPKSNLIFTASAQATKTYNEFQNYDFRIAIISPRGQWVNQTVQLKESQAATMKESSNLAIQSITHQSSCQIRPINRS